MEVDIPNTNNFNTQEFINDIYNIFDTYIKDGVKSFEDEFKAILEQNNIEYSEKLQKGTERLIHEIQVVVEKNMDKLEVFSMRNLFITVPSETSRKEVPSQLIQEEHKLDSEIKHLKKELYNLVGEYNNCECESKRLNTSLMNVLTQFNILGKQLNEQELEENFNMLYKHVNILFAGEELIYKLSKEHDSSTPPKEIEEGTQLKDMERLSSLIHSL